MGMVRDDDSISLSLSSLFFLHVSFLYSLILSYALSYLDDDDNDPLLLDCSAIRRVDSLPLA